MSDKTTRIPKEDILELLNELENEEKIMNQFFMKRKNSKEI